MKRAIVFANIVVALVLAGLVTVQALSDRWAAVESAYQDAENLTNALAGHTSQTFGGIDLGILSIVDVIERERANNSVDPAEIHRLLDLRQRASAATFAFVVLGPDGRLIATSRPKMPDTTDFSDINPFQAHRGDREQGLLLSGPRLGEVGYTSGRWIATMSRRVNNPDGSFGGVVAALLSIDYLLEFYNTLRIGEHGIVGLFSPTGTLIVRAPFDEVIIGKDMSQSGLFKAIYGGKLIGRVGGASADDGVPRIAAWRGVADNHAIVYVGLGEAEVLDVWRHRLAFQVAIALLAMLLFACGSAVTGMYLTRRQQHSERLKLIADETAALVRAPGVADLLNYVTEIARRLIGTHQAATSLTRDAEFSQNIQAVSVSGKYAKWRDYREAPDGSGIYRLVCENNRPMLMTQPELEKHPAWKGFGAAHSRHPPMRGWLAVPIIGQDGDNLGVIQLSDKVSGEFNQDDLNELVQLASVTGVALDNLRSIEARETALAEARAARAEIEAIFTSISDAVYALDADWKLIYLNAEAERLLDRPRLELLGKVLWEEFPQLAETQVRAEFERARRENIPAIFEFLYEPLRCWFSVRAFPHRGGLTVYFLDITRRVETEERLRQARKMDAIGQLTGGIAHDFNNLLTVILGNADTLVDEFAKGPRDQKIRIETIQKAGERGAELTHRLLAFARRQPLDPRTTNINELVAELEDMLRRTLGVNINIELVRGSGLWKAIVDPNQLENAILNLAINARDAMPDGGRLTIETANMAVDAAYAGDHQIKPGQYVMVAVSDTGIGMSTETIEKAFEPFFTTKARGKGSGLGLSMVYGFARQTGGHVKIYSEPGHGTTVRLYIPRALDDTEPERRRSTPQPLQRGTEHILLVEDDDLVRRHTVNSLRSLGYQVTESENGPNALKRLDSGQRFDLLLSDVMLPGKMSGKDVAAEAAARVPGIRILFMSGYSENAIVHHGRLDRGVNLLAKPFRLADLARKVREALDG